MDTYQEPQDTLEAGWSPERIQREINWSHYDDGRAKGHVAFVNPLDFLHATTQNKKTATGISSDAGELNQEMLSSESQSPFLRIRNGKIVDHEGRHRMAALAAAGHTSVPVVLWHDSAQKLTPTDSTMLKAQYPNRPPLALTNAIPLHRDYEDQIHQTMNDKTMSFKDGGDVGDDEGIDAFHGSPHDFQRFDMSKVGTGEGAQSFGHGLYLAEAEPIAKSYRDRLAKEGPSSGQSLADAFSLSPEQYGMMDENDLSKHMEDIKQNAEQTLFDRGKIKHVFNDLSFTTDEGDQIRAGQKEKGHMYAVKIKTKPENLLDWDAKFSEQPENIRRAIDEALSEAEDTSGSKKFMKGKFWGALGEEENKSYRNYGHLTGAALHHMLSKVYKPEELSQLLHSFGVKGIRYLDQDSRQNREGTRNYVIFDDKLVDIKRKYEQGGEIEMPAKKTGRIKRNTGGRIPEMDKLFKRAKKYVDEQTKPMLGLHDDVIVKALHIAKKKV